MSKSIELIVGATIIVAISIAGCLDSEFTDFQDNDPEPEIKLFELFDDYPSLHEMWENIDGKTANDHMQATFDDYEDEMVRVFELLVQLLDHGDAPVTGLLGELRELLGILLDTDVSYFNDPDIDQFFNDTGANYRMNLFANLDDLSNSDTPGLGSSLLSVQRALMEYLLTEMTQEEIRDIVNDFVDFVQHPDFKADLIDLNKTLSKLLMRANYPIWIDSSDDVVQTASDINPSVHTNTGIGNITKGIHALLSGFLHLSKSEPIDHNKVFELIEDAELTLISGKTEVYKSLITNLESYFTQGGDVYGSLQTSNSDSTRDIYNTDNTGVLFSNAELGVALKDTFSNLKAMVVREDRPGAQLEDPSSKRYTLARFLERLKNLNIDWQDGRMEASLYNMIRYDAYGRDRLNPISNEIFGTTYKASHLESLFFLTGLTGNFGFKHGGNTDEFGDETDENAPEAVLDLHGHGAAGEFSFNDSLFSLTSKKTMGLGAYELNFLDEEGAFERHDRSYRSIRPYSTHANEHWSYRFYYDQDYGVLRFLAGSSVGDYGRADGGNWHGNDGATLNNYTPYSPDGLVKNNIADPDPGSGISQMAWTIGGVARACMNGEGPYFYADPNALQEQLSDGRSYYKYIRPNGKTYAYVHKADPGDPSTWEYIYPAEGDDPRDHLAYPVAMPLTHTVLVTNAKYPVETPFSVSKSEISIKIGSSIDITVSFDDSTTYSLSDVRDEINSAAGKTICYDHGDQLKIYDAADNGPITLENNCLINAVGLPYFNPVDEFLLSPFPFVDREEFTLNRNAVQVTSSQTIRIVIDDAVDAEVTFSPGMWTVDEIISQIQSVIGSQHVGKTEHGLIFIGQSQDPSTAKIEVTNVGDGTAVQSILGEPSGTISMEMLKPMRYNRYKPQWRSDFYLMRLGGRDAPNRYVSLADMSGNGSSTQAGCKFYKEMIAADEPKRACASQEEALYRNYQWVMNEKKMVLIIPMYLRSDSPILPEMVGGLESSLFQAVEVNGWTGIVNARIFRENRMWAKAQTSDEVSMVPGDYRMDFHAIPTRKISAVIETIGADEELVYNETMGRGTATPYIVGANLPALYRLGFPLSPLVHVTDNGLNYLQDSLGSTEFEANDSDENWRQRNAIMPLLTTLLGIFWERSTDKNHALTKFANNLNSILMPYFFYNEAIDETVARDAWLPRVNGNNASTSFDGHNFAHIDFLAPDNFINGFEDVEDDTPTAYFGGWAARDYYQPIAHPTFLSFLLDSDPSMDRSDSTKRADGLLAYMTQYDVTSPVSDANPRLITNLIDMLMDSLDSENDDDDAISAHMDASATDFDAQSYDLWGPRRKIFYGLEQIISSQRMAEGRAAKLNAASRHEMVIPDFWFDDDDLRDVDLDVNDAIDKLVGNDDIGVDPVTIGTVDVLDAAPYRYPNSISVMPENGQLQEDELLSHNGAAVEDTLAYVPAADHQILVVASDRKTGDSVLINSAAGSLTGPGIADTITLTENAQGHADISFTLEPQYADDVISCFYRFDMTNNWQALTDILDDIDALFIDLLVQDSAYNIVEPSLAITDILRERLDGSDARLEALLYTLGKFLAYYNDDQSKWVYQGEEGHDIALRLLQHRLPQIHGIWADSTGENYESFLTILKDNITEEGLMAFLFDTVTIPSYTWETTVLDLDQFLASTTVAKDSELWPILSQLLTDLSLISQTVDDEYIADVIERYGFQIND
ncbi:MAG: hypothetical protein QNJ97_20390 [Myxococcota bacterium]|nr:hypothetical protein [Myxococcota bacterium]